MTKQELASLLESPEGQEYLKEYTAGIVHNRDKLKTEKREIADQFTEFQNSYADLQNRFNEQVQENRKLIKSHTIDKLLDGAKVSPESREMASALWHAKSNVDDNGNILADDGTSIHESFAAWLDSPAGKQTQAPRGNAGGSATGSSLSGSAGNADYAKMSTSEILQSINK